MARNIQELLDHYLIVETLARILWSEGQAALATELDFEAMELEELMEDELWFRHGETPPGIRDPRNATDIGVQIYARA